MPPFLKFLDSARRLIPMGMTRQQIFNFAKQEFGEVNQLMKKQIDNLFKPKKPVGKKDPDFDNTVEKMQFDDEGVPFNPRNPLKKAEGGRIGYAMGSEGIMQMASAPDPMDEAFQMYEDAVKKNLFDGTFDDFLEKIDQMRDFDKTSGVSKRAPSIKLADGGITRIGLKDGTFKKLFFNEESPILSGFNTAALFDFVVATKDLAGPLLGMADGGRAAYKDGPKDPRRRTFMKAAAGIASMLPFGATKIIGKAAPVIAKGAELAAPALNKIIDTVMTLGKTISQSGRRVKEMVTKKKHKDIEVEEDVMDGSYIIKKDGKEIYYKPGRRDEMGIDDDIIEVIDKTIKKAGGGIARMLGE